MGRSRARKGSQQGQEARDSQVQPSKEKAPTEMMAVSSVGGLTWQETVPIERPIWLRTQMETHRKTQVALLLQHRLLYNNNQLRKGKEEQNLVSMR